MSPSVNPIPKECLHIIRGTYYLKDFAPKTDAEGILMPCEQDRCTAELLVWRKTPRECAKTAHIVKPKSWPPKHPPGSKKEASGLPSMSLTCTECGSWVIVYPQPEDDEDNGVDQSGTVTIIKPSKRNVAVSR